MTVGEIFLESLSTGVITPAELSWLTHAQDRFSRLEEATALRLGRLLDRGAIQMGCRLPAPPAPASPARVDGRLEVRIEPPGAIGLDEQRPIAS